MDTHALHPIAARGLALLALIATSCAPPEPSPPSLHLGVASATLRVDQQTLLEVPIESRLLDRVEAAHLDGRVSAIVVHHGRHGGATLYFRREGDRLPLALWRTAPTDDLGTPWLSREGDRLAVALLKPTALAEARVGGSAATSRPWLVFELLDGDPRPRRRSTPPAWVGTGRALVPVAKRLPGELSWQAISALSMPYIHQVYDTPDEFNGHWACGPTSTLMAIQHFGRLPKKTITISTYGHTSDYGSYISRQYSAFGHTFSRSQGDASGKPAKGAYGHCTEGGMAWAWRMQDYAKKHNLKSDFYSSSSFSKIEDHLSKGKVVALSTLLTSGGHIITVKGTTADGKLVVNDPYGDRNKPSYPNAQGEGAVYSWSQVKAKWHITVHGTPTAPPKPRFKATLMGVTSPTSVIAGQQAQVSITLRNDGSETWNSSTRLGTTKPRDRQSELYATSWLKENRVLATGQTAPGATATLTFDIEAALGSCQPRTLVEHFNLLQEGVSWFSADGGPKDDAIKLTIRVDPNPTDPACLPEGADSGAGPLDMGGVGDAGVPSSPDVALPWPDAALPTNTTRPREMVGGCVVGAGDQSATLPFALFLLFLLSLARRSR